MPIEGLVERVSRRLAEPEVDPRYREDVGDLVSVLHTYHAILTRLLFPLIAWTSSRPALFRSGLGEEVGAAARAAKIWIERWSSEGEEEDEAKSRE